MDLNLEKNIIVETEKEILSILLNSRTGLNKIFLTLNSKHFSLIQHQELFKATKELFLLNSSINLISLKNYLDQKKLLKDVISSNYLLEIYNLYISDTYLNNYLKIVIEASNRRQLKLLSSNILLNLKTKTISSVTLIEKINDKLLSLNQTNTSKTIQKANQVVEQVVEMTNKLAENKFFYQGLTSEINCLDQLTLGFQKGELIIVAARPSMGKTALVLNIAKNIAQNNLKKYTIIFFSFEMPNIILATRLLALVSGINLQKIRSGQNFSPQNWNQLNIAKEKIANYNLFFDDNASLDLFDIELKLKKLIYSQKKVDLVIIDYLQLIATKGKSETRQQEIAKISRKLKMLARNLNIPIICVSQLSRNVERREDKKPMMSDLRDSGAIEQDADLILLLYRQSYYNKEEQDFENDEGVDEIDINICKNRNGPIGNLKLRFYKKIGLFLEK